MPRTRPWSVNAPLGARDAREIDDAIRELRVDLDERLKEAFPNWDTEPGPIVGSDTLLGKTTKRQVISPYAAQSGVDAVVLGAVGSYAGSGPMYIPIILPVGVTVTEIAFNVLRSFAGLTWSIYKWHFATANTNVPLFTGIDNNAGRHSFIPVITAPGILILEGEYLVLFLDLPNGATGATFDFYGAQVTYTVPDSRSTI